MKRHVNKGHVIGCEKRAAAASPAAPYLCFSRHDLASLSQVTAKMHGSPDAERSQSRSRSESRPRSASPHRRTARACDQCRRRKQRCDGASVPCQRCARVGKRCSFESEASASPRTAAHDARWGSGQALVLQRMQDEITVLRERRVIRALNYGPC